MTHRYQPARACVGELRSTWQGTNKTKQKTSLSLPFPPGLSNGGVGWVLSFSGWDIIECRVSFWLHGSFRWYRGMVFYVLSFTFVCFVFIVIWFLLLFGFLRPRAWNARASGSDSRFTKQVHSGRPRSAGESRSSPQAHSTLPPPTLLCGVAPTRPSVESVHRENTDSY